MITEQRLRFEAKHKVPEYVVFSEESNQYHLVDNAGDLDVVIRYKATSECETQNALWQGYQSALEDMQGEAVATVIINEIDPDEFKPIIELKTAEAYDEWVKKVGGPGEHKLFTSPQPAQPDTGNAIIEALIERITERFRAELAAVQAAEWTVYKLPPMSEVLRQMFGIMEPEQHEAAVKEYALQAVNNAILALRKGA